MCIRDRLRTLRRRAEVSQTALSEAIGYSKNINEKYENQRAEPCVNDLIKLAEYFEVSVDYLIAVSYTHLDVYKRQR